MVRSFQDRLGKYHDSIKSKLIDNHISLAGQAVDMIRIRYKRTKQGDMESRTIIDQDTVSISLPPLRDIPMRRLVRKDNSQPIIDSLSIQEFFPFEIYSKNTDNVQRDDVLIRVLRDVNVQDVMVMCLQVKDEFGTFGASRLLWRKMSATYFDEQLPQEVINIIVDAVDRREVLGW